ncbi:hypothetical protein OJAV_G00052100 [Oryzias javanicus]|uniref:Uncharacterized protein n=1 Tax=Oryzias javanicus TaxID=123683 RepID=A0A437D8F7_ORYJA|nr:hypothetical protein OJAV_G00052100 [Oryzias javanicus]
MDCCLSLANDGAQNIFGINFLHRKAAVLCGSTLPLRRAAASLSWSAHERWSERDRKLAGHVCMVTRGSGVSFTDPNPDCRISFTDTNWACGVNSTKTRTAGLLGRGKEQADGAHLVPEMGQHLLRLGVMWEVVGRCLLQP